MRKTLQVPQTPAEMRWTPRTAETVIPQLEQALKIAPEQAPGIKPPALMSLLKTDINKPDD